MSTYTVIWRDNGEDFMFTEVSTSADPKQLSSLEWVLEAADVEYADWDEQSQILAKAELLYGYELLSVLVGTPTYVH
jgi:hypothetical protein